MIRKAALFALTLLCAVSVSAPQRAAAQTKDIESHPAYQVVVSYLTYAMGQDWPKSSALIDTDSLANLRDRYIARIGSARTVQEEIDMCRALDCTNLTEAKTLDPTDFYIRYHEGIEKRYKVSQEKLDTIMRTKRVKLLSLGEESHQGKDLAHVLVRTKHENGEKEISSLELISLLKVGGKWLVTLDAMRPTVEDSASANGGTPKK
jgi:hypothetical protein